MGSKYNKDDNSNYHQQYPANIYEYLLNLKVYSHKMKFFSSIFSVLCSPVNFLKHNLRIIWKTKAVFRMF